MQVGALDQYAQPAEENFRLAGYDHLIRASREVGPGRLGHDAEGLAAGPVGGQLLGRHPDRHQHLDFSLTVVRSRHDSAAGQARGKPAGLDGRGIDADSDGGMRGHALRLPLSGWPPRAWRFHPEVLHVC